MITQQVVAAIKDDASLQLFLNKMKEFDAQFCQKMCELSDYTIRLEVRGNKGELLHCRVYVDVIDRPNGAQGRIDKKVVASED